MDPLVKVTKMNLIDRFVARYIRRNFSHERQAQRQMILRAVTDSMRETFTEDNLVTRYYALTIWMLDNDPEFKGLVGENPQFRATLAEVLKDAALENN